MFLFWTIFIEYNLVIFIYFPMPTFTCFFQGAFFFLKKIHYFLENEWDHIINPVNTFCHSRQNEVLLQTLSLLASILTYFFLLFFLRQAFSMLLCFQCVTAHNFAMCHSTQCKLFYGILYERSHIQINCIYCTITEKYRASLLPCLDRSLVPVF